MHLQVNQPSIQQPQVPGGAADLLRQGRQEATIANPLLGAYYGMIPEGPVLFLGGGNDLDAVQLACRGRTVTVFEEDFQHLALIAGSARALDVKVRLHQARVGDWRLGFQRWSGIVALFGEWPVEDRRRLFTQVPNALMAGGVFLMEGRAIGPLGPMHLDDHCLDPEDVRPELEILHLARFATVYRPVTTPAGVEQIPVLQAVGVHEEAGALDEMP